MRPLFFFALLSISSLSFAETKLFNRIVITSVSTNTTHGMIECPIQFSFISKTLSLDNGEIESFVEKLCLKSKDSVHYDLLMKSKLEGHQVTLELEEKLAPNTYKVNQVTL